MKLFEAMACKGWLPLVLSLFALVLVTGCSSPLTGCSSNQIWYQQGVSQSQTMRDLAVCQNQALVNGHSFNVQAPTDDNQKPGLVIAGAMINDSFERQRENRIVRTGMIARGYTLVDKNALSLTVNQPPTNPFTRFYHDYTSKFAPEVKQRLQQPTVAPEIRSVTIDQLPNENLRLAERGFVAIGYSAFNGPMRPLESATEQAVKVEAEVVLYDQHPTNDVYFQRALFWRRAKVGHLGARFKTIPDDIRIKFTAIPQDLRKSWNILFSPATRQG